MSYTRLVVLASGYGSNLQAILDASASNTLDANVVAVVSDKPDAYALVRARQADVAASVFSPTKGQDRRQYDTALAYYILGLQPDWIVLAGWMRLLSTSFLQYFPGHIVNIHPALPGQFPGTHAIERAWDSYQRGEINHTGVMVHLVPDEGVDNGPVLGEIPVTMAPTDTLQSLSERMHAAERMLLVQCLQELIDKDTKRGA